MCATGEYFNGATGQCVKIKPVDESKYDGSTSFWGYIPEALPGVASIIAALKGNNTAPVTNNYNTGVAGMSGSMIWIILAIIVFIILLVVAMRKGGAANGS